MPTPEAPIAPQTGAGNARERPSWEPGWVWDCCIDGNLYTAADVIELRRNVKAALRSSHREGAEAMREAAARACSERGAWAESKIADDKDNLWATYSNACDDCAEIVRARPMPGKTDAG